jgi:serine/threonine-protein kinase
LAKDPNARFTDVAAFINALTGRPLQTLDRARAKNPAPEAFASTQAAVSSSPPSTGARGEITPSMIPPTTAPAAKGSDGRKAAFIVGALLAAIGGTLGVMKLTAKPPAQNLPPVVSTTTTPPKVETTTPPPTGATVVAPPPNVELHSAKGAPPPKKEAKESLPPEIAAELDAAEKAIDGEPAEAVRQARHTLAAAKSSRAFAIIARAFCKQGDLGNAKAALHSVGSADRARVLKYCKAAGTDLQ